MNANQATMNKIATTVQDGAGAPTLKLRLRPEPSLNDICYEKIDRRASPVGLGNAKRCRPKTPSTTVSMEMSHQLKRASGWSLTRGLAFSMQPRCAKREGRGLTIG